jgi:RNA polymerase sigma-70 factor (ECF subfamily)
MEPPPSFDPSVLVAHAGFVRRLARGLVRRGDDADELAAETTAAAVAQRPDTTHEPSFRGWLKRVLGRVARRRFVAAERRLARERLVSRPELDERARAPVDVAAQLELERRLAEAFATLAEPYRTTLFRRYWLDLTPTQIAEQTATPLATVKSRLQRGLEELRERLDAAHGGKRESWLPALVPFVSFGGPTVMATKSKVLALAAAALVIAGASVVWLEPWKENDGGGTNEERSSAAAAGASERERATASGEEAAPPTAPAVERAPVAVDESALPFASGIVVDGSGAPIGGVDVVASCVYREFQGRWVQQPLRLHRVERDRVATTDASGRFRVAEPLADLVALRFLKDGFGLQEWSELSARRSENQEHRVVLRTGGRLAGIVLDSDRKPVAGARLTFMPSSDAPPGPREHVATLLPGAPSFTPLVGWQETKSDASGAFRFASFVSGPFRLTAAASGYGWAQLESATLPSSGEIVLTRDALLLDVVDVDTGEPLRAAAIVLDPKSGAILQQVVPFTWPDADHADLPPPGRLSLHTGFGDPFESSTPWLSQARDGKAEVVLRVIADGYVADELAVTLATKKEPPHLHVELTPRDEREGDVALSGRVTGAPRAALSVYTLVPGWSEDYLERNEPLLSTRCGDDGSFQLRDLPLGRYRLAARAEGFAPAWLDAAPPARDLLLELTPSASIEARVRDRAGKPVKNAVVHAQPGGAAPRGGAHAWGGRTDENGIALLEGLPATTFRIAAFDDLRFDLADTGAVFPIKPDRFPDDLVVTTKPGERTQVELAFVERLPVTLHFERDDGSPATSVKLSLTNFSGPVAATYRELERLRAMTFEIDPLGDARVELFPGHYEWQASESSVQRRVVFDVTRVVGQRLVVRLPSLGPTGELSGRLVELGSGKPIAGFGVHAVLANPGGEGATLGERVTDADGRFRFEQIPAGAVRLIAFDDAGRRARFDKLKAPAGLRSPYDQAEQECAVEPGRVNEVEIALPPVHAEHPDFPTLELVATVRDPDGRPLEKATVRVKVSIGAASCIVAEFETDEQGRGSARVFTGDSYRLLVNGPWPAGEKRPPFQSQQLDATPRDGVVAVEVVLQRRQ